MSRIGKTNRTFTRLVALETDECVLWPHTLKENGYPIVGIDGRRIYAHRLALLTRVGPPPTSKHEACHQPNIGCQRHCINYRHLRWGTRFDNMSDALKDGSVHSGEDHYRHTLTEADVRAIRASSSTQTSMAQRYGVTQSTISRIRSGGRRRTWKHVS